MRRLIHLQAKWYLLLPAAAAVLMVKLVVDSPTAAQARPPVEPRIEILAGESNDEYGISTWAVVSRDGEIDAVGVTIPVSLAEDLPTESGDGPAGAIASLRFPELVQQLTFFNHFELQWNPDGHVSPPGSVNPDRNHVPHFDYHFYAISEEQVWDIPLVRPPSPLLPIIPAERLPAGYTQPGFSQVQMGRHATPTWSLADPEPLSTIMLAGFPPDGPGMPDPLQIHFVEPMISVTRLLERNDFELPLPLPEEFGQTMLYPTKFEAEYDGGLDAYDFVFSKFVLVE